MSRRCRSCGKQFRPSFGAQRFCLPCYRGLSSEPEEDTMSNTVEPDTREEEAPLLPDLRPAAPASTLFGTNDPERALAKMSELARMLVDVVRMQGLSVRIAGREHLRVEAWRALGGMVGVHAVTAWTRPNETGDGILARVEALTRAGELVGASESECSRSEATWAKREAYAIRAMAETRAASRALRGPLGQIVVLAGYEPAAAEEVVEAAAPRGEPGPDPEPDPELPRPVAPTIDQVNRVRALTDQLEQLDPDTDWKAACRKIAGVASGLELTSHRADFLIGRLQELLKVRSGVDDSDNDD